MQIRKATVEDKTVWLSLRKQLWPGADSDRLRDEADRIMVDSNWAIFLAENEGEAVGFIECSIRDKAPGCETDRIGYIEGWYVVPEFRRKGIGRSLVEQGEKWAKEKGCKEMASDTTSNYPVSPAAHNALGYEEVKRKFFYRKPL
jgi:aminoglycoside 6'-N-acetyltransferase I